MAERRRLVADLRGVLILISKRALLGANMIDYNVVLGIAEDADEKTIRNAFRALARRHRSDVGAGSSPVEFQRAREAYEALVDPGRRRHYDRQLRASRTHFVDGTYASGSFFETLGISAMRGRTLTDADDQRDGGTAGPVAMISPRLWQRRFGGAADIVGRTLSLDRVPFAIVGVLPPSFTSPTTGQACDVVIPIGTVSLVSGPQYLDQLAWR
jgi:hypothetical protein